MSEITLVSPTLLKRILEKIGQLLTVVMGFAEPIFNQSSIPIPSETFLKWVNVNNEHRMQMSRACVIRRSNLLLTWTFLSDWEAFSKYSK